MDRLISGIVENLQYCIDQYKKFHHKPLNVKGNILDNISIAIGTISMDHNKVVKGVYHKELQSKEPYTKPSTKCTRCGKLISKGTRCKDC